MKTYLPQILQAVVALIFSFQAFAAPAPAAPTNPRLEWWREARFGMFIHWGPVSLKGTEIGWSRGAEIPVQEYDSLYKRFNPTNFNADEWMRTARAAGMKYVVFTTKHHDGFCMWDTKQTDFNIMHSPFGRDVVKELAAACKKEGLAFATYHSVCDWHNPDFPLTSPGGTVRRPVSNLDRYEKYLRAQVGELIQNYGPLLIMWYDVPQEFDQTRGQGLLDYTRSLQADIIINNRSGAAGDYDTPEQHVGTYQDNRPWETCMTLCNQWAWKPNDEMKSLKQCLQTLVRCAGGDGNLLFNVAPTPGGVIEPRQVKRLTEMGDWLKQNGEAVYATRGGPWKPTKTLASTRRDEMIFLHMFAWEQDQVTLPTVEAKVLRARLLNGGPVSFRQEADTLIIQVPASQQRDIDTIVCLDIDRPAKELKPVKVASSSIKATASNVFQSMDEYAAEAAFDDEPGTRWATDSGTSKAWVALDLEKPTTIKGVTIEEALAPRVKKFEFQYRNGGEWKTLFSGTGTGGHFTRTFDPVTAREVRLNILEASEGPTISEIKLLR